MRISSSPRPCSCHGSGGCGRQARTVAGRRGSRSCTSTWQPVRQQLDHQLDGVVAPSVCSTALATSSAVSSSAVSLSAGGVELRQRRTDEGAGDRHGRGRVRQRDAPRRGGGGFGHGRNPFSGVRLPGRGSSGGAPPGVVLSRSSATGLLQRTKTRPVPGKSPARAGRGPPECGGGLTATPPGLLRIPRVPPGPRRRPSRVTRLTSPILRHTPRSFLSVPLCRLLCAYRSRRCGPGENRGAPHPSRPPHRSPAVRQV